MEKHFLLGLVLLTFKLSVKCVVINPAVAYHLEYDLADNVDWVRIPTMVGEWIWTHRRSVNAMMKQHRSDEPPVKIEFLLYTRRDTADEGHPLLLARFQLPVRSSNKDHRAWLAKQQKLPASGKYS